MSPDLMTWHLELPIIPEWEIDRLSKKNGNERDKKRVTERDKTHM